MIRTWQDREMPYYEKQYNALTPHYYWDGGMHYWTAMAVKGTEDQDSQNPNCCPLLDDTLEDRQELSSGELRRLRRGLRARGHSHRGAGERLGMGLSRFRQRLYGRRAFLRTEFYQLCRMAALDPKGLKERGLSNDRL
jgi:hypothetical protein